MNTYNYADESADIKGKVELRNDGQSERLTAINDLQTMLSDPRWVSNNILPNLDLVMEMIEKNIFRPLPNKKKSTNLGMSETGIEQEEQVDPSWPHLQVIPSYIKQGIYEFFLQLVLNDAIDVKSMKVHITPRFIQSVTFRFHLVVS